MISSNASTSAVHSTAANACTNCNVPLKLTCNGNSPASPLPAHQPTQQIVRQQVRPHLLTHHLRRLATEYIHLQRLL